MEEKVIFAVKALGVPGVFALIFLLAGKLPDKESNRFSFVVRGIALTAQQTEK